MLEMNFTDMPQNSHRLESLITFIGKTSCFPAHTLQITK